MPRGADSLATPGAGERAEAVVDSLLHAAVTAARIGMWELDVVSGKVIVTDRVREIYGLGPNEQLTFELFAARIHPEDRPVVLAQVESSLAGEVDLYDVEHRLVWSDRSVHWVHVSGNVLVGEDGRGTRMIGTMVDVTERKEAEQKLAAHGQLLRQLIAHTPAAVAMFDKDMRYLETSQRWLTDYHLEGQDVTGRSHYEVFPDVPERWKDIHRRVLAGAVERCDEDPFPRADGSIEWLQWEVRPWRDASGDIAGLIMFTQVITERKRAQEALERAEDKFSKVFWSAPVALCLSRVSDGMLADVNHEFERLFGHSRAEAIGRTTVQLGMWPDPEVRKRLAQRPVSVDAPNVVEVVLRAKDGMPIPVSISAYRVQHDGDVYTLSALSDLTERRRADAAIRSSESRMRRVFSTPILGMAFVSPRGQISEANAECLRILGYTSQEVGWARLDLKTLTPAEYRDAVIEVLTAVNEHTVTKPREIELLRKDGNRVPVLLGMSAVDEGGSGHVAFVFDLSERRGLERQLLHAQRMEAVGRLAAGIAHDFNNVLSAINMGTELLRESLPDDHVGLEDLKEVRKAADRAIGLVKQLLAFSRQQVLEPRVLGLNELVVNLRHMLQRLLGEGVELVTTLSPDLHAVKADPGQIEQMILNLVVNARDAMPDGGRLGIATSNVKLEEERPLDGSIPPGDYAVLSVSDTGMGMDAATRSRMFEPFFTTKEQGKGTGLGLSTVYGIVRQSGGAIDVTSEPAHGTTLRIFLPRVAEAVRVSMSPAAPDMVGGTETLLIVEDDAAVRRTTRKLLVSMGYRVLDSENAAAALALARVYVGAIDLVLTDLVMPGKNGRDLALELLEIRPKLRLLFMSGYTDDVAIRQGALAPGSAFIQKPFTGAALARKVRGLLDTPH